MSKVTSKLQVTIPKRIAEQYRIRPGDEVEFVPAGDVIRLVPRGVHVPRLPVEVRLRLFNQATERQRERDRQNPRSPAVGGRGWTREELYTRGRPR